MHYYLPPRQGPTSRQVWNALRHVSAMRCLWLMQGRCVWVTNIVGNPYKDASLVASERKLRMTPPALSSHRSTQGFIEEGQTVPLLLPMQRAQPSAPLLARLPEQCSCARMVSRLPAF